MYVDDKLLKYLYKFNEKMKSQILDRNCNSDQNIT